MGIKTDIMVTLVVAAIATLIIAAIIASIFLALKAFGALLILFGIFMIFAFPSSTDVQESWMSETGIIIGLVVIVAGLTLIFL